ncbi:hypothetical protein [Sporosarcina cyprini]|uniref:hypothetical protein n=1 Tax=Sporosarcina cyprini TaxID=2910523 RepID=UPI001EDDFE26|nr:hypothetical protein [Sporosarcina cyprini]MCG3086382.1 hypothetical protein [Sporosarcina cyprini]
MSFQLKKSVIKDFRNTISGNNFFVLNRYRNHEGKNKWNIICSAMDWIEVAVEGMPAIDLKHSNANVLSLNFMQLVCAMDLVKEAIDQLFRVFSVTYPYTNDSSVFNNEVSDDSYFKHVRAVFGTHPVNLKGVSKGDNGKYYASWSSANIRDDFSVVMYSNSLEKKSYIFSVKIENLFRYITLRYDLLNQLNDFVEKEHEEHIKSLKVKVIPKNVKMQEQVEILLKENEKRYGGSDAYSYELSIIKRLLQISYDKLPIKKEATEYLKKLSLVLDEIQNNLQEMELKDLSTYAIVHPENNTEFQYEYSKVFDYIHNDDNDFIAYSKAEISIKMLMDANELPNYALNLSKDELLLVINTLSFNRNESIQLFER